MMLVPTYLAQSGIHGSGLFAGAPIAKGTKIWEFMAGLDVVFDAAMLTEAPEPIRSFLNRYSYPHHTLTGKAILDGDHGRFMNHDDAPNTDFSRIAIAGYALRDVARGEELTCNYHEFAPDFTFDV